MYYFNSFFHLFMILSVKKNDFNKINKAIYIVFEREVNSVHGLISCMICARDVTSISVFMYV